MPRTQGYLIDCESDGFTDRDGQPVSYSRLKIKLPELGTVNATGPADVLQGLNGSQEAFEAGHPVEVNVVWELVEQNNRYRFKVRSLQDAASSV
jgi:hypothetical protein